MSHGMKIKNDALYSKINSQSTVIYCRRNLIIISMRFYIVYL